MKITFLGANRQVTGSRHFLEAGGLRILIDSGLFQERSYEDRNWQPCPVDPKSIDLLLLTHAHLDHCGLLPKLVRENFRGPIYATPTTLELAGIVMNDSARINEEDAIRKAERHAAEGRKPKYEDKPLYTQQDAARVPPLFKPIRYDAPLKLNEHVSVRYFDAGHILGSASIEITVTEAGQSRTIVFSGDIGMPDRPILRDPVPPDHADYLIMESTYGDRDHDTRLDVETQLARVITDTVARGGNIVIPTFAIERAQELMYMLSELIEENRIPHLLVFLDSPMA
ncbi:MAG: MBL fold metallo-hydrolase, partial [Phycisphaeraceae bacterium]